MSGLKGLLNKVMSQILKASMIEYQMLKLCILCFCPPGTLEVSSESSEFIEDELCKAVL